MIKVIMFEGKINNCARPISPAKFSSEAVCLRNINPHCVGKSLGTAKLTQMIVVEEACRLRNV